LDIHNPKKTSILNQLAKENECGFEYRIDAERYCKERMEKYWQVLHHGEARFIRSVL